MEIGHEQQQQLQLFALQTLLKCLLYKSFTGGPDPHAAARELARIYELSVGNFPFNDRPPPEMAIAAREHMLTIGQQWISESLLAGHPVRDE